MPIRFRCAYCNQLMGIAHRKAGTVVKCPKCAGEIIVPVPEGTAPVDEGAGEAGEDPHVESPAEGSAAATAAAEPPPSAPVRPEPPPPKRVGVFLSLGSLIISVIVIILLLILMFLLGLIIGKQSAKPEAPKPEAPPVNQLHPVRGVIDARLAVSRAPFLTDS